MKGVFQARKALIDVRVSVEGGQGIDWKAQKETNHSSKWSRVF